MLYDKMDFIDFTIYKKLFFFWFFRILCDDVDSFELNKLLVERFLEK